MAGWPLKEVMMLDDKYEGHSPTTCNYNECLANVNTPCPFMKESVETTHDVIFSKECEHEWRQYLDWDANGSLSTLVPKGFYCIYCKTISK
jgi:hypothetical protein